MKKCILGMTLLIAAFGATAVCASAESAMDKLQEQGIVETVYEQDFEAWTGSDGVLTLPPADSFAIVDDAGKGNTLKMHIGPPTTGDKELLATLATPMRENAIVKYSVRFADTDLHRKPMGILRDSSSTGNELNLLQGDKSGRFVGQQSGAVLMNYEADAWYEFVYVFNFNTQKFDLYINGEKLIENEAFKNKAFSNIKRIWLLKLWDNTVEGDAYVDDIGIYRYKAFPTAELLTTKVAADADDIKIMFSSPILAETVKDAVSVADAQGNPVSAAGALEEDKMTYTLKLREVLKPAETYKISFADGIISEDEMELQTEGLNFTTKSAVIDEILFRCGGADITEIDGAAGSTVTVYCFVHCEQDANVMLIAGLYCNGRLAKLVSREALLADGKRFNVNIPVPDDGNKYEIRAFAWDGKENQNAYIAAAQLK